MILHCMPKELWENLKHRNYIYPPDIQDGDFIHCSLPEYFHRVIHKFTDTDKEYVILCIDESRLTAPVHYHDFNNSGRLYPHIHGPLNINAVENVLPLLTDNTGKYIKNPIFDHIENR